MVRAVAELTRDWKSAADCADCLELCVDCSKVQFLSSDTLSKLILLQSRLKQKRAKLVLSGLRAEVRDVLRWTKLDRFLEIAEDAKPSASAVV